MLTPKRLRSLGGPRARRGVFAWIACLGLTLLTVGCPATPPDGPPDDGDEVNDPTKARTCEGCHTLEDVVKALATDDDVEVADSGEG